METTWKNVCQAKLFFDFHRKHTYTEQEQEEEEKEEHGRGVKSRANSIFFVYFPFFKSSRRIQKHKIRMHTIRKKYQSKMLLSDTVQTTYNIKCGCCPHKKKKKFKAINMDNFSHSF